MTAYHTVHVWCDYREPGSKDDEGLCLTRFESASSDIGRGRKDAGLHGWTRVRDEDRCPQHSAAARAAAKDQAATTGESNGK